MKITEANCGQGSKCPVNRFYCLMDLKIIITVIKIKSKICKEESFLFHAHNILFNFLTIFHGWVIMKIRSFIFTTLEEFSTERYRTFIKMNSILIQAMITSNMTISIQILHFKFKLNSFITHSIITKDKPKHAYEIADVKKQYN